MNFNYEFIASTPPRGTEAQDATSVGSGYFSYDVGLQTPQSIGRSNLNSFNFTAQTSLSGAFPGTAVFSFSKNDLAQFSYVPSTNSLSLVTNFVGATVFSGNFSPGSVTAKFAMISQPGMVGSVLPPGNLAQAWGTTGRVTLAPPIVTGTTFSEFYNNHILPVNTALNKLGDQVNIAAAGMSAIGLGMLLKPRTFALGVRMLHEEATLFGEAEVLDKFSTVPLSDPPLNLPPVTPSGVLTEALAAKFTDLVTNEFNLVHLTSDLSALVQRAVANPAEAESLIPQINSALDAVSNLSKTQSQLFQSLLTDFKSGTVDDVPLSNADFLAFLANLVANGFPPEEIPLFHQMGFSDAQLADLIASLYSDLKDSTFSGSLYSIFEDASRLHAEISEVTNIAAVPEPSTWAMMILGFAGVGFLAYRRSRKDQGLALAA